MRRRKALLALLMVTGAVSNANADDPRFDFLEFAESFSARQSGTIELMQGIETGSREVTQPTDFSPTSNRLTSLRGDDSLAAQSLDLSNLNEVLKPELSSSSASTLNTPAQVEAVAEITGRVDTGIGTTAPIEVIPASTFSLASQPDVAETIAQASTAPTVKTQQRSPIAMDPRVRGYHGGQVYTMMDGAFLSPVRLDLDAILTKVDQSLIGSSQVISGPYGLRYGSGFSFINVDSIPTPRYENGAENHLRLGTQVRPNGGQTYNTATLMGGGDKGGYYVNLGYRKGSDYKAGNGLAIPSSYEAMNLFSAYGRDLTEYTRMETKFSLLDQGQTEYAGQFFDVDALNHYGITHSFIHLNEETGFGWRIDGWVSNTEFNGDTDLAGKRRDDFAVLQRVESALIAAPGVALPGARFNGDVDGDLTTAGFRAGMTSDPGTGYTWGAGTDLRYVQQEINEQYDISEFGIADPLFETGLPTSEIVDPGLYAEVTADLKPFWTVAMGGRVAFASTNADGDDLQTPSNFKDIGGNINRDLDTSDTLLSAYLTNDIELTEHCSTRVGVGYAERLPDLTDRYSDGLFLAVIQSGFSRVIGNPELEKERNVQLDARFDVDYENVRGRVSVFHSWIADYNTYAANAILDPLGARLLQAVNTDQATLYGFESYLEADLTDGLQSFASLAYLEGNDEEIDRPLPGIFPLEGRVGLRLSDTTPGNRWGLEWGWRIVDEQDRLAFLRAVGAGQDPIQMETFTPSFVTSYLRGYIRPSDRVSITLGAQNLFDRTYYEHLNLRLPADGGFNETVVLSPGITPYFGVEIDY
ncbi:iron complex outermembrane receptor protein [Rhodopirellula rubra]|uniref:Iron complex outermembrane receptor protein n=1 Tax=Aporhodopirellula rubra TaxID=980271 RepID=A0A7W5H986_9BACT|nr:TonB-dependent receptor [Aporhodopirellula rubra]MBB3210278.1 iron complex outermembrane receptor protein [Aporhodopirellula rubra]